MSARRVWARICVGNADKTPDQLADAASSIQIHPSESTKARADGVPMSPLDGPAPWMKCLSNSAERALSLIILLPPGVDVQRRSWTQGTSANAGH